VLDSARKDDCDWRSEIRRGNVENVANVSVGDEAAGLRNLVDGKGGSALSSAIRDGEFVVNEIMTVPSKMQSRMWSDRGCRSVREQEHEKALRELNDRGDTSKSIDWPEKPVDDGIIGLMTDSTGRNRRHPVGTGVILVPPNSFISNVFASACNYNLLCLNLVQN
jgi:hypothetical protein